MSKIISHFALFFDKENDEVHIVAVRDDPNDREGDFETVISMKQFLKTSTDEPIILTPKGQVDTPTN